MTSPYLHRQKRNLSEFKRVSEFDKWVEDYGVTVMPDPTKHRPRLLAMPSFWALTSSLIVLVLVGCAVMGYLS